MIEYNLQPWSMEVTNGHPRDTPPPALQHSALARCSCRLTVASPERKVQVFKWQLTCSCDQWQEYGLETFGSCWQFTQTWWHRLYCYILIFFSLPNFQVVVLKWPPENFRLMTFHKLLFIRIYVLHKMALLLVNASAPPSAILQKHSTHSET